MDYLLDFVNKFVEIMKNIFLWAFDLIVDVLKTAVFFIFDGALAVIQAFLSALDLGSYALSYASYWGALPSQLVYLLNACMVPQALTLLAGAYTIRFIINLIPGAFTRV